MKTQIKSVLKILFICIICITMIPYAVRAASGTPNSAKFGYGARVDLQGEAPQAALNVANDFNFDWVAIDVNWEHLQPEANQALQLDRLDTGLSNIGSGRMAVMLSIRNAPAWAMTENGPDPQRTADLVALLVNRYPGVLQALELFPYANTIQGWGTSPNPRAYAQLLETTFQVLQNIDPRIVLVAAGLTSNISHPEDINDVTFLEALYAVNAANYMPVVGLRLSPIGLDPLTPTRGAIETVLRHYETIRHTMTANGHKSGLIWITGFSWDANKLPDADQQAAWLKQAYLLLRSQLYIGVAFFDGLNPSPTSPTALLLPGGAHHAGFDELIQLIALDHNGQTIQISSVISKKIMHKDHTKAK